MEIKTIEKSNVTESDLYSLEELITSCEELGLFKIQRVVENGVETPYWTFEVIE